MINKVSLTQNKFQTSFKANIPETLGKKACDKMAKQLLETGTQKEQAFAKQYFSSIKKIKKEKGIDEVLLCSTNKATSMPYVSAAKFTQFMSIKVFLLEILLFSFILEKS